MASRRPGDKPLSEPMMIILQLHICVTRPQWVKKSVFQLIIWNKHRIVCLRKIISYFLDIVFIWNRPCSIQCGPLSHWRHDDVIKWKHFPRYWPFVRGIHRSPRSFDVFFDLRLIKRLSTQSRGWWFEMLSHPLWHHCNGLDEIDAIDISLLLMHWNYVFLALS